MAIRAIWVILGLGLLLSAAGPARAEEGSALVARLQALNELAYNDPRQAAKALRDLRSAVDRDGDVAARAHWHYAYGAAQDGLGNLAIAEHNYREAITLAEQADATKILLDAAYTLALLLNQTERYSEVADIASKYLLVARQAGDLDNASALQQQLGRMFAGLGDEENALLQMKEAYKVAEQSGSAETLSLAQYNLAIASSAARQYDLAQELFEKSLAYDREQQAPAQNVSIDLVRLGQAIEGTGDLEGAQQRLQEAVALARPSGFVYEEALAMTALSKVSFEAGQYTDAAAQAERALELLGTEPVGSTHADARAAHARALAALGQPRAAAAEFQQAMEVYDAKGKLAEVAAARSGLADAQAAMGDLKSAFASSRRAVEETQRATQLARQRARDALHIAYSVEREAAENERLKAKIAAQNARLEEQVRRARWQRAALSSLAVLLALSMFVYGWQRRMRRELLSLATTDPLTNVANRRAILEYADAQLRECVQRRVPLSVVALDVDNFKGINDRLGHEAGDRVLCQLSEVLSAGIRKGDMIGRLGGEEFLIVLPGYDAEAAAAIADRLRETLAATDMSAIAEDLRVTCSFGVASLADCDSDFGELLRHADRRLYRAKDVGRNKVVYLPRFERTRVFTGKGA